MQRIDVKPKRDDMLVGTLETKSPLFQAFPVGSIVVLKPNGKNARSDMQLGTLRQEWATTEGVSPESYEGKLTETVVVEANPLGNIGTLRDTMARALGLPAAALELRMPDGSTANPKGKVARFLESWGVD
jgi:hypothetical protein